jgi:hypothetical protein
VPQSSTTSLADTSCTSPLCITNTSLCAPSLTWSSLDLEGNHNSDKSLCQIPTEHMCHPFVDLLLKKQTLIYRVHEPTHHIEGSASKAPTGDQCIFHPNNTDQQET